MRRSQLTQNAAAAPSNRLCRSLGVSISVRVKMKKPSPAQEAKGFSERAPAPASEGCKEPAG